MARAQHRLAREEKKNLRETLFNTTSNIPFIRCLNNARVTKCVLAIKADNKNINKKNTHCICVYCVCVSFLMLLIYLHTPPSLTRFVR